MNPILAILSDNEIINGFITILQAAVVAVTGALCFVCRLLWTKSEKCESDRYELRNEIEELKEAHGHAKGELISFNRCPDRDCPFKEPKQ